MRAIRRVEDLTVRLSGRVTYGDDVAPTWQQLSQAKVWTLDDYAPLRNTLRTQPFTFNISEAPDSDTFTISPSQDLASVVVCPRSIVHSGPCAHLSLLAGRE